MTTDTALLAAIKAAPDDDWPRGVYADWCDDHGQPERAAYIRDSVRRKDGGQYSGDAAICRANLPAGTVPADWPDAWGVQVHRGFVRWVMLPSADWLAHADALLAAHPIRRVRLATVPGVDAKSTTDICAPPGWPVAFGIGRRTWRWESLGRPAINPHDTRSVAAAVLAAEWPGVEFDLPIEPVTLAPRRFRRAIRVSQEFPDQADTSSYPAMTRRAEADLLAQFFIPSELLTNSASDAPEAG